MFGYVTVNQEELKIRDYKRYRSFYCGLCYVLNKKYGRRGQISLTYDMTYLTILLNGLYELPLKEEQHFCIVHPGRKQTMRYNQITEYAADMTMLFAYYKCQDDVEDDNSVTARTYLLSIRKIAEEIIAKYPRQAKAAEAGLSELHEIEQAQICDLDRAAGSFGRILGELFVYREDVWADELRQVGFYLGKYIYLLDGFEDLEQDLKKKRYNPWFGEYRRKDFDALVENTLTMMMADCARAFEKLPILQDVEILRNIIYSGVWMKYRTVRERRDKEEQT